MDSAIGAIGNGPPPSRGTVVGIHIAPGSRLPTRSVPEVVAEAGMGLVGDRYHGSRHRHVTVQSLAQLSEASELLGTAIDPADTRRNITVSEGVIPSSPGALIGIGDVELVVVRVAAPCKLLDDWIGRGARSALRRRAGSVCRVLTSGTIVLAAEVDLDPSIAHLRRD